MKRKSDLAEESNGRRMAWWLQLFRG